MAAIVQVLADFLSVMERLSIVHLKNLACSVLVRQNGMGSMSMNSGLVVLSKVSNFRQPHFFHLFNGDNNSTGPVGLL